MDYPHPYVEMDDNGKINLDNAYDTNIGEWDKIAITYGYGEFASIDDAKAVLRKATDDGYLHISDRDARPTNGAHPIGHLWDNGKDAAEELNRMMKIRRQVLNNFSEKSIREGMPMSSIEEVLVAMYLFHRYQVDGTSKVVGGLNYSYALKGDGQTVAELIPAEKQKAAIASLIATMQPDALRLPQELLGKIPPKAHGYRRSRETFISKAGPVFDYFAVVETAASLPLSFLLNPHRANRMEIYKAMDPSQPGLSYLIDQIVSKTWKSPSRNASDRALQKVVESQVLIALMKLYTHPDAYANVKAIARAALSDIVNHVSRLSTDKVYYEFTKFRIEEFLNDPKEFKAPKSIKAPDGSPIGTDHTLGMCSFGHLGH